MKKIAQFCGIFVTSLILALGAYSCVFAAETEQKTIEVSGVGTVKVTPDLATIQLGVTTKDTTSQSARDKNAEIMEKLLTKLKSIGVKEEDIVTSDFSIYPNYNYNETTGEDVISGYTARNMIDVKTKDVDNASRLLDAAISAGANVNRGIVFSVENPSAHYAQALRLSVDNAKISAQALAGAIGVTLGEPVKVQENSSGYSYSVENYRSSADASMAKQAAEMSSTEISYDKIEITARVTISYVY